MEFIDLNKAEEKAKGKVKVQKFTIDYPDEAVDYENLMNRDDVEIIDEKFSYDRTGKAVTTVW